MQKSSRMPAQAPEAQRATRRHHLLTNSDARFAAIHLLEMQRAPTEQIHEMLHELSRNPIQKYTVIRQRLWSLKMPHSRWVNPKCINNTPRRMPQRLQHTACNKQKRSMKHDSTTQLMKTSPCLFETTPNKITQHDLVAAPT